MKIFTSLNKSEEESVNTLFRLVREFIKKEKIVYWIKHEGCKFLPNEELQSSVSAEDLEYLMFFFTGERMRRTLVDIVTELCYNLDAASDEIGLFIVSITFCRI